MCAKTTTKVNDYTNRAACLDLLERATKNLHVVFDGPPGHESGRFVEVENDTGASVRAGEWAERPDGLWDLTIPRACPDLAQALRASLEREAELERELYEACVEVGRFRALLEVDDE